MDSKKSLKSTYLHFAFACVELCSFDLAAGLKSAYDFLVLPANFMWQAVQITILYRQKVHYKQNQMVSQDVAGSKI